MATDETTDVLERVGARAVQKLRLGVDLVLTSEIAKAYNVNQRTVERWITKPKNPLPAVWVSEADLRTMGYQGNMTQRGAYLVRRVDLALIPQVRAYPKGTSRRRRGGTTTEAGVPERQ